MIRTRHERPATRRLGVAGEVWHLAKRFAGSLKPGPPSSADEEWARSQLLPGERRVWDTMSNPDRRHACTVARAVDAELSGRADRPVVAAALLHDSGKVVSGLRTPARVVATCFWLVAGDGTAAEWRCDASIVKRRLAQYRLHPTIGADQLAAVGSDPLTVDWTREHHLPPEQWTVPADVANVLKSCDDD